MIVFYGRLDDPPFAEAIARARERGLEHVVVEQQLLDAADLVLEVGADGIDGQLVVAQQSLPLGRLTSAYARPLELPASWLNAHSRARAEAFHQIFIEWLDLAPGRIVNRPGAMESNSSKPFQAQLIARAGFAVPETLVTSDPDEVRSFWDRHGRLIYKSVSGVRSIVRELDADAARRLDRVRLLPTQFQAHVSGVDLRAHVIGDRVLTAQVVSPAIDYRYAALDGQTTELEAVDLPAEAERACVRLAGELGLPFCGIDLRRTPSGELVCFEVNPMPGYTYYEQQAGLPISDTLVDWLARAA